MEGCPGEVDGHGDDPSGQKLEGVLELPDVLGVIKADEELSSQPEGVSLGEWEGEDLLLVVPVGSEVALGDGVHDAHVALESLGLHEAWEKLTHLLGLRLGRSLLGGWEDLVHGAWPPCRHQLVLVRKEELVAGRPAEDRGWLSEDGRLEDLARELGHAVKDELLWMTFPSG
ncbi:hypothetical protein PanWU01x14_329730 [Parasponia andersonii]|uniref:Uncharacterized protein n=1 Tax=Parasponia andersonii TaxID=3476 RepID=A0A2P5AIC6_PARAD|nr:hypothetical protein PanWU01x14_329730 [Parasponia andersonii]